MVSTLRSSAACHISHGSGSTAKDNDGHIDKLADKHANKNIAGNILAISQPH
jgi:hypothetical protein